MRNRTRIMLLVGGVLALTAVIVGAVTFWLDRPNVLSIATGPPGGAERRFAERLEGLLERNHASIRLSFKPDANPDLAILRTDATLPSQMRSLAVLEHEMLLIIGPRGSEMKSIADLRGRRLAVLGEDGRNEALVRKILDLYQADGASTPLRTVAASTPIDSLLETPGDTDFVITFEPLSRIAKTKTFEELSQRMGGFALYGISDANALERKIPGLYAEVVDAGLVSGAPRIPDKDMDTVAVQKILAAREDTKDQAVVELMRLIFENKGELAIDQQFATRIEPPDLDKDSLIAAHDGATQYVESDVENFFDRYSDMIYLVLTVGSVVGSVGVGVFTTATRVKPSKAGERAHDLLGITDRIRESANLSELDIAETELEDLLKEVLRGLKDGTIASDGLDAFRLGYEHARDALGTRRRALSTGLSEPHYSRPA